MVCFIIDFNEEWGMMVIMIEYDMGVVMDIFYCVMVLDFGQKVCEGLFDEVMENEYVQKVYFGVEIEEYV